MIYLQLFLSYLKIGFFGFGGGYAMLSLLQNEVVVVREWITAAEFADIVAVSQVAPGAIAVNSATYIGYDVAGFWGAVVATTAVCLPALTIMILVTRFYLRLSGNRYVAGTMSGMRPVVAGMIAAAVLLLVFPAAGTGASSFTDVWSWAIFGCCLAASLWKKTHPIWIILISAAAGLIIYGPW